MLTITYIVRSHRKTTREQTARQNARLEAIRIEELRRWNFLRLSNSPLLTVSFIPKIRLLSFDGGGVRGISSLIVLQCIMDLVAPGCRPCEVFDLIGGTSTGGLIAIMLGRLRMSVREAIQAFQELSREIFNLGALQRVTSLVTRGHQFSGETLEMAIKQITARYTHLSDRNEPLKDQRQYPCKSFAVAIPGCNAHNPVKLFRTYDNPRLQQSADECAIWEAGRATACAPSFFPEIQVNGVVYADGGVGYNNPSRQVLDEARSLWGQNCQIDCLLSIGTGLPPGGDMYTFRKISDLAWLVPTFVRMATDSEREHQNVLQREGHNNFYHRFNVPSLKKVGLDEWEEIGALSRDAYTYVEDNVERILTLGGRL